METCSQTGIKVSVICPTYNQGRYLRQGLDSILNQKTTFEIEILIGEDCSPDNTNEILAEYEANYPGRLQVFHREKNLKQSKNVYDLFMRSKGEYIIILDLDDYWTDAYKLQKQVDFLESHPEYIGTAHDFSLIDAEGNPFEIEGRSIKEFLGKDFTLQDFLDYGFVYQTGTFCYRNIWREDTDWSIIHKADETVVDLTINSILLSRQNVFILPDSMSVYRDVVNAQAKNCRSESSKDRAKRWQMTSDQLARLTAYFEGKIDYSRMWSNVLLDYFKAMCKKQPGSFSFKGWRKMWKQSSKETKSRIKKELSGSLKRKLKLAK